ncbi:hypothetical protein L915_21201 [Phytophthora nicotianae]|uniref:Uncharacterized protein n=1 Tax=Phytophthora nicotianae TaxID=4792 RepID=W2M7J9_PHYNI|nr:hypothetical protein L915_21201 [Phytophthora nicotianae]ETL25027.1 hypothetical protein L916_21071 [Phytophthora nicotianae]ETM31504.1 hypothetical protein L914_20943 [Phytophthora nicotianae]
MSRREPRPRGALNHALHRAYDALMPHRRRDPARLEKTRELLLRWAKKYDATLVLLTPMGLICTMCFVSSMEL